MKCRKYLIFILLIVVVYSCNNEIKDVRFIHPVKTKQEYNFVKIDSLCYSNNSSQYIGRVKDITLWNNHIIISDIVFNKIWIFDRKLSLIKTFGQKGKGPGEFESSPLIILKDSSIVLYDFMNYRATILNTSFELTKTILLKREKIVRFITPLYINGNYVFAGGGTSSRLKDLFNGGSLLLLDDNFRYLNEILQYDEKYQKRNAFIVYNDKTYLAKGNNNSFFALQSAARKMFHINDKFNVENIIEISPKYYKEPPEDDILSVSKSLETMGDFYAQITCFKKLDYDNKKDHIYIYYINYHKEMVTERNWLKGEHYLQILDKDYNLIVDKKIDGIFLFVEKGNIYILTEENPEGIKINVYNLAKIKNE